MPIFILFGALVSIMMYTGILIALWPFWLILFIIGTIIDLLFSRK